MRPTKPLYINIAFALLIVADFVHLRRRWHALPGWFLAVEVLVVTIAIAIWLFCLTRTTMTLGGRTVHQTEVLIWVVLLMRIPDLVYMIWLV